MAAIDLETDGFFGSMANMRLDLEDYQKWCQKYESFRDKYVWETRDGTKIPISQMSDTHIQNSINYCKKREGWRPGWIKALNQEQTYRGLKKKIQTIQEQLSKMEDVMDKVF